MDGHKKNIYKKGSYIYIEGDEDVDEVFIIEDGIVELKRLNLDVKYHRGSIKSGDIFGFTSSLSSRPRLESALAKTDVSIIEMTKEQFISMLQKQSEIAIKVINYFADELRKYDNLIFSSEEPTGNLPGDEKLFKLGKYYFEKNIYENSYYILNRYIQLYNDGVNKEDSVAIIKTIENTGFRKITEPVHKGLYVEYMDKQIIFCENEPGDELFLIKKGKVKIVKNKANNEIMLSVLKENDIFGELAIVSDKLRNATAISFGNTELLPINRDSLLKLFNQSPEILKMIFSSISKRVWFTYIRLEAKLYNKALTRIYTFIENKLVEEKISLKSKKSNVFNFGIDELLKMVNLSHEKAGTEIEEIFNDQNISLNFGQIIIKNASLLSSKARFYRSRDNLSVPHEGKNEKNTIQDAGARDLNDSFLDELNEIEDIDL